MYFCGSASFATTNIVSWKRPERRFFPERRVEGRFLKGMSQTCMSNTCMSWLTSWVSTFGIVCVMLLSNTSMSWLTFWLPHLDIACDVAVDARLVSGACHTCMSHTCMHCLTISRSCMSPYMSLWHVWLTCPLIHVSLTCPSQLIRLPPVCLSYMSLSICVSYMSSYMSLRHVSLTNLPDMFLLHVSLACLSYMSLLYMSV